MAVKNDRSAPPPRENPQLPSRHSSRIVVWVQRFLTTIQNLGTLLISCCGHFPRGRERVSSSSSHPTTDKTSRKAEETIQKEKPRPVHQKDFTSRSAELLAFYQGTGRDALGRFLEEILEKSDDWLESKHNYIQWLFPTPVPSRYAAATSPLLNDSFITVFQQDPVMQENWKKAFLRILAFYGLELIESSEEDSSLCVIRRSDQWQARYGNWLTEPIGNHPNHNHLRITRILSCMSCLEMNQQWKEAFYQILIEISEQEGVNSIMPESKKQWHQACYGDGDRQTK